MPLRFVCAFLLAMSCSITSATFHVPFFARPFPFTPFPMAMPYGGFGGGPGFLRTILPNVVGGYGFDGSVGVGVGGGVGVGTATVAASVDGNVNVVGGSPAGVSVIGGATVPASSVMYYGDGVDISRPDVSDTYLIG
ncbi:uncharacterized protein [Haliotis asinina]|uniref:uncharacterized protein n=1 Tax=Haliotis asinina TaxID=109174 RepID=UPI0035324088